MTKNWYIGGTSGILYSLLTVFYNSTQERPRNIYFKDETKKAIQEGYKMPKEEIENGSGRIDLGLVHCPHM